MAKPKESSEPSAAPSSHPILKLLLAVVLLGFLGAVGWVTYLHYEKDGAFSFRIFDSAWWSPGVESSQPVIDSARSVSHDAHDAVWGDHGLVAQASNWWSETMKRRAKAAQTSAPSTATPAPAEPAAGARPAASAELPRLEQLLSQADDDFGIGLDQYRSSSNAPTESETRDLLLKARSHFLSTADLLSRTIPRYGRTPGYDRDRLDEAKSLQDYNQRLLNTMAKRLDLP